MWIRKVFSWLLLWSLCLYLQGGISYAQQDISVGGFGPYFDIARDVKWGASAIGGANNNFLISPNDPAASICIFFHNNNNTSGHSFNLVVSQTGDPRQSVYTQDTGAWIPVTVLGIPSPLPAGGTGAAFVRSYAAARLAVSISGATTQAGTPDTVNIFAVTTHANSCGPVPASQTANNCSITVPNESGTGTVLNSLAKITGAPSTAIVTSAGDTSGQVGIVIGGAGRTGVALLSLCGLVPLNIDGATVAGDYIAISAGSNGKGTDVGATYPTSGDVIGRVLTTNVGAGQYIIDQFPPEMKAGSGAFPRWDQILNSGANKSFNMASFFTDMDWPMSSDPGVPLFKLHDRATSVCCEDVLNLTNNDQQATAHNYGFIAPGATLDLDTTDAQVALGNFGSLIAHNTFISASSKTNASGGINQTFKGIIGGQIELDSTASGFSNPPAAGLFSSVASGTHIGNMTGVSTLAVVPDFNVGLQGGTACGLIVAENATCSPNGTANFSVLQLQNTNKPPSLIGLDLGSLAVNSGASASFTGALFPSEPIANSAGLNFTSIDLGDLWGTGRAGGTGQGIHIHAVESNLNSNATAKAYGMNVENVISNTSAAAVSGIHIGQVQAVNSSASTGIDIAALVGDSAPGSTITGIHIGPTSGQGTFKAIQVDAGGVVNFSGTMQAMVMLPGYAVNVAGGTSDISGNIVASVPVDSMWHIEVALNCTATSASATENVTIGWTDTGSHAQTLTFGSPVTCTALGSSSIASFDFNFRAKAATAITYATTRVNTPTWDLSIALDQRSSL